MPSAKNQELVASLVLRDQLSGPLAQAKGNLSATETSLGRLDATARATGTSLGGLGASIGQIAKAGAAAFVAFQAADFFAGSIKAAADEEVGIKRLSASLKANADARTIDLAAIEQTIKGRERLAFSDNELRDSLASLVGATHDIDESFRLQSIAMDLARFSGKSLEASTDALIKVQAGSTRVLKEFGIQLDAGASKAEAFAAIQKLAAGQAQAFGETTAGAMQSAQIAIDDLQESVGARLAPTVKTSADSIRDFVVPAIGAWIDSMTGADLVAANLRKKIDEMGKAASPGLSDALHRAAQEASGLTSAIEPLTEAQIEAALAAGRTAEAHTRLADPLGLAAGHFGDISDMALAAAGGLDAETVAAAEAAAASFKAADDVDKLRTALDLLPTTVDITVTTTFIEAGAGVGAGTTPTGTEATGNITDALVQAQKERDADAQRARDKAAREAAAQAKKDAAELAAAYKDMVSAAFDKAKRTADTLFDALHDRHVKAIRDAETLAEKQHDAALQNISDALKAAQAADAAPVNAAEQTLRDRQQAQQRRDLVEAQAAAQAALQANRDPTATADLQRSLRSATEALQNFDAQAAIDRLKVVQTGLDNIAQGKADVATKAADAELAAAKKKAQDDLDAETKANAKRKADFDLALAALEKKDLAANKTPAQIQADIDALSKKSGITIDPRTGLHHIDDPLVNAIKNVKIEPAHVTVINDQKFFLKIGASDLRLIAAALASGQSPTAAGGVRTGGGGRG